MNDKIKIGKLLPVMKGLLSQSFVQWQKKGLVSMGAMILLGSSYNLHAEFEIAEQDFSKFEAEARAAHFLSQATMGSSYEEIQALGARMQGIGYIEACEEWIDDQLVTPRSSSMISQVSKILGVDGYPGSGNLSKKNRIAENFDFAWWDQALNAPDKLRQRISFAHSQTFVVSKQWYQGVLINNRYISFTNYYDKLQDNAFGTHRELLQDITYDPFMGAYLSLAQNSKGDPDAGILPDQNFAREVMQLFSCGVFDLFKGGLVRSGSNGEPLENYDDAVVFEMAQAFTGLSLKVDGSLRDYLTTPIDRDSFLEPMVMVQDHHDTTTKELLNGVVLPANQDGDKDISDTLDNLAEHRSTAPYQTIGLIKRLTSSNPSRDYVSRVVDVWLDTGGNYGQVVKAILLDPEARDAINYSMTGSGSNRIFSSDIEDPLSGRLKEPILKLTQFYKFAGIRTNSSDGIIRLREEQGGASVQYILNANSVFNYYDAFYAPGNGPIGEFRAENNVDIVSPEMQLLSNYVIPEFETMFNIIDTQEPGNYWYNGTNYVTTLPTLSALFDQFSSTEDFVAHLDLALCNGQMPNEVRLEIASILDATNFAQARRNAELTALIFNSADFSVSF